MAAVLLILDYCGAGAPDEPPQGSIEPPLLTAGAAPKPDVSADGLSTAPGSASIAYSDTVRIDLDEKTAHISFSAPAESGSAMVLHILVDGREVAATDLIVPGEHVSTVPLTVTTGLAPGIMPGSFIIDHVDAETAEQSYFSLSIDTTVEISN